MFDCLILGDSIAVGLHSQRPDCVAYAKGGINTWQYNRQYTNDLSAKTVIISLGSNDHKYIKTRKELELLRNRVKADQKVVWILPSGNHPLSEVDIKTVRDIIADIARLNGDSVINIESRYVSTDKIHPTGNGYKWLANETKK